MNLHCLELSDRQRRETGLGQADLWAIDLQFPLVTENDYRREIFGSVTYRHPDTGVELITARKQRHAGINQIDQPEPEILLSKAELADSDFLPPVGPKRQLQLVLGCHLGVRIEYLKISAVQLRE